MTDFDVLHVVEYVLFPRGCVRVEYNVYSSAGRAHVQPSGRTAMTSGPLRLTSPSPTLNLCWGHKPDAWQKPNIWKKLEVSNEEFATKPLGNSTIKGITMKGQTRRRDLRAQPNTHPRSIHGRSMGTVEREKATWTFSDRPFPLPVDVAPFLGDGRAYYSYVIAMKRVLECIPVIAIASSIWRVFQSIANYLMAKAEENVKNGQSPAGGTMAFDVSNVSTCINSLHTQPKGRARQSMVERK
ncbi:MAG: hypothetical protein LQ350_001707 [Teloschistes chrysophthalmus]|nr:MAG: hypothetical protein LQ350_001707 [Niorma chrysophthalma]